MKGVSGELVAVRVAGTKGSRFGGSASCGAHCIYPPRKERAKDIGSRVACSRTACEDWEGRED